MMDYCAKIFGVYVQVLDDNRELFIPETREVVKAHPHFILFGTQNPPGIYGGRKVWLQCLYGHTPVLIV